MAGTCSYNMTKPWFLGFDPTSKLQVKEQCRPNARLGPYTGDGRN